MQKKKFKQGYRKFRQLENKVSVYIFLLIMLMLVVAGLLYITPEAPDSLWFVAMLSLFVFGIASAIGAWTKKVNKNNQKDKSND